MAFQVEQFRAKLQNDGARPNLFEVRLNFPTAVVGNDQVEEASFMIKSAQLPGSTIGSVVVPYFGREVKLAGNRTFPDWTITVINDEDFVIRNKFERWMNAVNQHALNRRDGGFPSPTSYTADSQVLQYGKTGSVLKIYNFVGMFPIDMSPIDLDWGSNDTIEEFTVTLQYQYWQSSQTT
jgi:hypothetical protein